MKYRNKSQGRILKKDEKVDTLCKKNISKIGLLLNFADSIKEIDKLVLGLIIWNNWTNYQSNETYLIKGYKSLSINNKIIDLRTW